MESNEKIQEKIFDFPFKPYDIQQDFMNHLYHALDNNKVGIFESPTGTGKSLSLICGALTWLFDYEEKQKDEINKILSCNSLRRDIPDDRLQEDQDSTEPDWVDDFFKAKALKDLKNKIKESEEKKKIKKSKLNQIRKEKMIKRKRELLSSQDEDEKKNDEKKVELDCDADLMVEEYLSDNDIKNEAEGNSLEDEDNDEEEQDNGFKIFYCSRTHSQLTQFIHEVKKSPFSEKIKLVALGSRQNFCINPEIQKLNSGYKINEKCLDLQKKSKEKKKETTTNEQRKKRRRTEKLSGCPFYNHKKFEEFKDYVSVEVQDIEQLVSLGKDLDTCPYYGSRYSVSEAQLVVLPYQTLLHKYTRETVGIKLKGNVVIIDEGHNLVEAINNIHSVEITLSQILQSINELAQYKDRYQNRLKAKNLMYIDQMLFVLKALLTIFDDLAQKKETGEGSAMKTINNFVYETNIDNVNLFKIQKYCRQSLIARKLNGFVDRYPSATYKDEVSTSSQFVYIEAFLEALTNADKDGRILITNNKLHGKSSLKFLLLNPAVHFIDVVNECKAVIIAGGTMQPVSEFKNVLLYSANIKEDRILEFSCGHVIPSENLAVVAVGKGPTSQDFDFTYQNRNKNELIDELGRLLCNICSVVPGGVVCFFASYDYEEIVFRQWFTTGLLQKIQIRKKIFREPKKSSLGDKVLLDYTKEIKKIKPGEKGGALLLSVVGGKMSEGINFSDELGRCIIMVGLPYPSINSPELKEKMNFLNQTIGPTAGQEHYENICMKAVNQSIGRAIRHKGDYASIILLDQRYSRLTIKEKLPAWISSQLHFHPTFGSAFASISKFFAAKRSM